MGTYESEAFLPRDGLGEVGRKDIRTQGRRWDTYLMDVVTEHRVKKLCEAGCL